jgi:Tfp pilus assembly protein PilO
VSLARRILGDTRAFVIPLVLGLLINVAVYALVVYPLRVKSETAADRAVTAATARQAAQRDQASAQSLVTGKTQADHELATFYEKVLPSDHAAARRMTYARVPALAKKANVKYDQRSEEVEDKDKNTRFGRLRTRVVLQGDYESLRQFIYELETTPDFIIVDELALTQNEPDKPLTLSVTLSTYYRQGANGT